MENTVDHCFLHLWKKHKEEIKTRGWMDDKIVFTQLVVSFRTNNYHSNFILIQQNAYV